MFQTLCCFRYQYNNTLTIVFLKNPILRGFAPMSLIRKINAVRHMFK